MSTIKDRTIEFIDFKGIKKKTFEQKCGLSTGYITSMRKGFGSDKLNNVLTAYPELNREWLLYGEGEMLNKEATEASAAAPAATTNTQSENTTAIAALKDTVDRLLDTLNRQMAILEDTARTNDRYSRVIERMTMQQQTKNEQPDSYLQRRQDVG